MLLHRLIGTAVHGSDAGWRRLRLVFAAAESRQNHNTTTPQRHNEAQTRDRPHCADKDCKTDDSDERHHDDDEICTVDWCRRSKHHEIVTMTLVDKNHRARLADVVDFSCCLFERVINEKTVLIDIALLGHRRRGTSIPYRCAVSLGVCVRRACARV